MKLSSQFLQKCRKEIFFLIILNCNDVCEILSSIKHIVYTYYTTPYGLTIIENNISRVPKICFIHADLYTQHISLYYSRNSYCIRKILIEKIYFSRWQTSQFKSFIHLHTFRKHKLFHEAFKKKFKTQFNIYMHIYVYDFAYHTQYVIGTYLFAFA